jgi:hypothetical protein
LHGPEYRDDMDGANTTIVLTDEEISSGSWLCEADALALTGLDKLVLAQRRKRGKSVTARPRRMAGTAPRDYWYWRDDIERIAATRALTQVGPVPAIAPGTHASGDARLMADLELTMTRFEAKEHELETLRVELRAARDENARLHNEVQQWRSLTAQLSRTFAAFADTTHEGEGVEPKS